MIYGYARVSTKTQRLDRQIRNIEKWAGDRKIEKIYKEKYTGTTLDRPQFSELCRKVEKGDIIVFDSVSRMSRTAEDGYNLYMKLMDKGVELVFINEPHINTSVYKTLTQAQKEIIVSTGDKEMDDVYRDMQKWMTKFQNIVTARQIKIAFEQAEKEVTDLQKRISDGISTTKENNKHLPEDQRKQIGRRKDQKYETKRSKEMKAKMNKHLSTFGGSMSDKEFIETYHIGRNTFYKYKLQLLQAMAAS